MIFYRFRIVRRRWRTKSKPGSKKEFAIHREAARALVFHKLNQWNQIYNLSYNKVFIRNQRSRWGSCSTKKNLNFNYKVVHLPPHLVDYLIVHELCHLQEMNHGPKFWDLVARTIPDYKKCRAELRRVI